MGPLEERYMKFSLQISPLDLDLTLGCGQVFRWTRDDDGGWTGILGEHLVELRQSEGRLLVTASPGERGVSKKIRQFLRASDDITRIHSSLAEDPIISPGLSRFEGLRIVKMDEWECLASYVLATFANIPRITKMIHNISMRYGHEITEGHCSFPSPTELRKASIDALRGCGLGYRARYLHAIANRIDDEYLERLMDLDYSDLREELMLLPGVGEKVADCVSLFGFGKLDAFPIDVWIERAVSRLYHVTGSYREIRRFAARRWPDFAGYAQEYLYFNERSLATSTGCEFTRCAKGGMEV